MSDGCLGLQFYIDTGRMEEVTFINYQTGVTRQGVVFCKRRTGIKSLAKPKEAKQYLVPNFCPSCGAPFIHDGEHSGEPSCTGRLVNDDVKRVER